MKLKLRVGFDDCQLKLDHIMDGERKHVYVVELKGQFSVSVKKDVLLLYTRLEKKKEYH